ncbi:U2 small nuclear ribonucleoprotein auxiliary factor subunit-related protein 1 [Chionoecetes opilio]|uniref:U2 small nuclear ribonucleoprotein auxiliary factor subunit-related protein 1 n=1 Tax=Chionoecetes opilio TaxID=41210 RepID=A0A8J4YN80_CHIOP|nr:U2 small nuclear ribonucleoprotein auxiliary factor subunit-related protein 1 [Chionoecetes opilio]
MAPAAVGLAVQTVLREDKCEVVPVRGTETWFGLTPPDLLSHKVWRQIVKRERRRRMRRGKAQHLHLKHQQEQAALMQDPVYLEGLERLQLMEEEARRLEEEEAERRKEEWMLRDAALHSKFIYEKRKKQLQEDQQKRQEELIKKEWEEKQNVEEERKKKAQDALLQAATQSLEKGQRPTHNPEPPLGYSRRPVSPPRREPCPFFIKTGACRFGVQCSRDHVYPERSTTVLLPNMYTHFGMEHLAMDEKDSDIALEYSESEIDQLFRDFFDDVLPEFQRCGQVVQFKVCCNMSAHLRGNVYVQFLSEAAAATACGLFNGRWYAGRPLTCYLVTIDKWKSALCGLNWRKQCPKGGHCNFLHAYRNPGNAFWQADKDLQPLGSVRRTPTPHRSSSERAREQDTEGQVKHRVRGEGVATIRKMVNLKHPSAFRRRIGKARQEPEGGITEEEKHIPSFKATSLAITVADTHRLHLLQE